MCILVPLFISTRIYIKLSMLLQNIREYINRNIFLLSFIDSTYITVFLYNHMLTNQSQNCLNVVIFPLFKLQYYECDCIIVTGGSTLRSILPR